MLWNHQRVWEAAYNQPVILVRRQFMTGFLFERLRLPAQGKDDSGAQRFSVIWLSDYQL
jgi:hypothetical protein